MSFFQNPLPDDFEGSLSLGDRHHSPTFIVSGNSGRGKEIVYAWKKGPFDMSGNDGDGSSNDILTISFRLHNTKNWATISVDVTTTAASVSAVKETEIIAALNANTLFTERFVASIGSFDNASAQKVMIRQRKPITEFQFYVHNGRAESLMGFNARAGIAEMPTYFSRHTIANRFNFADSEGKLILLNPLSSVVDANLVGAAVDVRGVSKGFVATTVQTDWQLLSGRSGLFTFTKGPSNSAVASTEVVITYPAGARAGDFAMKTTTRKDAGSLVVNMCQEPYTLVAADLITPPATYSFIGNGGILLAATATVTVS